MRFALAPEEYGIDILKVQEIRKWEVPTRMPEAPAHLAGVLNLRGVIVPILDLRQKFRLETASFDANTVTIVLALARGVVGVVVDGVSDVVNMPADAIKPVPEMDGQTQAHVQGLGVIENGDARRMLILLDIERLLQADILMLPGTLEAAAAP